MLEKVNDFIISNQLIKPGDKIIAACSGGPDSLVLVDILHKLKDRICFQLAVAHVDHMFRGEESAADAQFVKTFCQQRELLCCVTAINVPQYLSEHGGSPEDIGRQLRYRYLRDIAADWGGAQIATGHHRDDQAETLLLHLFRGSGGSGLSGIKPKRNGIIRPLLGLTRQEIEEYCRKAGLEPRLDSTNQSLRYLRNRIRLSVIPRLEAELGISLREPLCRTAQILAEQQNYFETIVQTLWPAIACERDDAAFISVERLLEQHIAVKRLIFRKLIEKKQDNLTGITFHHVEKLIEMAEFWPVGSKLDLPGGLRAERGYDSIRLGRRGFSVKAGIEPPGVPLSVPGVTAISQLGLCVKAELHSVLPQCLEPETAVFDFSLLHQPLYVRTRQSGDRFYPQGMQGGKKLKDFFIDKKIARNLRDSIPIFCDSKGIIFWIGGFRCARHVQVAAGTTQYLKLQIIGMQEAKYEYDE
jgi:tRNA(Ile)-lysidine synthase